MPERRDRDRFRFGHGFSMRIMDRLGAWEIPCTIIDVSESGAKLHLDAPADGIDFKDFVLMLAPFGTAHRACELTWRRGDFIRVRFVTRETQRFARAG